jgi:stage IV sporulation protein FB
VVRSTFLILAVFATVVLHEFGHALTARRFGVRTQDITLLPIGGIARLEKLPDKPGQQLLVAFAGPAVNLAIALAIFVLLFLGNGQVGIESFRYTNGSFLAQLMWINVSLAVFNLLPGAIRWTVAGSYGRFWPCACHRSAQPRPQRASARALRCSSAWWGCL